jgi:hypothetical protein
LANQTWFTLLNDICQTWCSYGVIKGIYEDFVWYQEKVYEYQRKYKSTEEEARNANTYHFENLWGNFDGDEIESLGGKENIIKHLTEGPGMYERWMMEGK